MPAGPAVADQPPACASGAASPAAAAVVLAFSASPANTTGPTVAEQSGGTTGATGATGAAKETAGKDRIPAGATVTAGPAVAVQPPAGPAAAPIAAITAATLVASAGPAASAVAAGPAGPDEPGGSTIAADATDAAIVIPVGGAPVAAGPTVPAGPAVAGQPPAVAADPAIAAAAGGDAAMNPGAAGVVAGRPRSEADTTGTHLTPGNSDDGLFLSKKRQNNRLPSAQARTPGSRRSTRPR
ncbi:hypothetical protein B1T47_21515 [Mycobacterium kansasii]|nr:hypothetical protein B1T47_21515 [Mycobacterium kansasii]